MLPATVVLTPLFIAFNQLNILNTYIGPILTGQRSAFLFCFNAQNLFLGIPKDLEDAAKIDGCSRFTAFIRIILPISVPGLPSAERFLSFHMGRFDLQHDIQPKSGAVAADGRHLQCDQPIRNPVE